MNGQGRLELLVVGRVVGVGDLEASSESLEGLVSVDPPVVMLERRANKEAEGKKDASVSLRKRNPTELCSSSDLTIGSFAEASTSSILASTQATRSSNDFLSSP